MRAQILTIDMYANLRARVECYRVGASVRLLQSGVFVVRIENVFGRV